MLVFLGSLWLALEVLEPRSLEGNLLWDQTLFRVSCLPGFKKTYCPSQGNCEGGRKDGRKEGRKEGKKEGTSRQERRKARRQEGKKARKQEGKRAKRQEGKQARRQKAGRQEGRGRAAVVCARCARDGGLRQKRISANQGQPIIRHQTLKKC